MDSVIRSEYEEIPLKVLNAWCVFILKVNNATARVVTKKPQTPLVNGSLIITHTVSSLILRKRLADVS